MSDLRPITARVRGVQHGPIMRLISPDGWGEQLKPFIFLDFFNARFARLAAQGRFTVPVPRTFPLRD